MLHPRLVGAVGAICILPWGSSPAIAWDITKDVGKTIEKSVQDVGKSIEKATQDTSKAIGKSGDGDDKPGPLKQSVTNPCEKIPDLPQCDKQ